MKLSKLFESLKSGNIYSETPICDFHRELYDLCVINSCDENIKFMKKFVKILEDVFIMDVKMDKKLCEYKLKSKHSQKKEGEKLMKRVINYKKILKNFDSKRKKHVI
jgi:hypothetical protein